MLVRRTLLPLIVLATLLLMACGDDAGGDGAANASPGATGVLLVYREVQCLGNPWEGDWHSSHPGQTYPPDEPARQTIFETYWRTQNIAVSDVRRQQTPGVDVVCAGCNCPTGFEWRVRVPPDQVTAALARGFRRV
jgi:hypothetical protein